MNLKTIYNLLKKSNFKKLDEVKELIKSLLNDKEMKGESTEVGYEYRLGDERLEITYPFEFDRFFGVKTKKRLDFVSKAGVENVSIIEVHYHLTYDISNAIWYYLFLFKD